MVGGRVAGASTALLLARAELLARQVLASHAGTVPEQVALARYQEIRDRLSRELVAVTERVAAYDWDPPGIRSLLRRFSAAMGDEVEHLEQLDRADVAH